MPGTAAIQRRRIVRLAVLLAATAGIVNAVGFFAFETLVTNVTGHFAHIAHEIVERQFPESLERVAWVVAFFAGGFIATALMVPAKRRGAVFVFAAPIALEAFMLIACMLLGPRSLSRGVVLHANLLTGCLLFAMGIQNATITVISGVVVRTTHLTGTLTDLGVNAGHYIFDDPRARGSLGQALRLHGGITLSFTVGALVGGLFYHRIGFAALIVAVALLTAAWIYDEYYLQLEMRERAREPISE